MSLHPIDVALIVIFMSVSVGIGLWLGRKSSDLTDFALGGRNMPWWALLGSIVATETSTATFLGITGRPAFEEGDFRFLQLAVGFIVGRFAVAALLLPQYFKGNIYTAYQVLEQRFGPLAQRLASVVFMVARNLGDGLRLYLCAVALNFALGISLPVSIIVIGAVTILYTVSGGMKSVVWNDCIQFVVYVIGGIAALVIITRALPGGWDELMKFAAEKNSFRVFVASPPAETSWLQWLATEAFSLYAGLLGGMVLTLGTHGADQMMVQRYLCARSRKDAARALVGSGFVVLTQFALFLFVGVAIACWMQHVEVPTDAQKTDRIFAWFIVNRMPVGLAGITLAAVFAAAMSTLSSSLSSSATAMVTDFARTSEQNVTARTRIWTVVFGLVQIGIATGAQFVSKDVVGEALAIAGFTAGVLLGVFLLGLFSKVGQRSAVMGMIAGIVVVASVHFGTDVAWPWYAIIGATTTYLSGACCNLFLVYIWKFFCTSSHTRTQR